MGSITLEQANTIIEAILKRGAELDCRPISAVVVEPGCIVKAFQKEDGASMVRFEMALGKAYAALALGRSSKLVRVRQRGEAGLHALSDRARATTCCSPKAAACRSATRTAR